jgi:hypothetical protein
MLACTPTGATGRVAGGARRAAGPCQARRETGRPAYQAGIVGAFCRVYDIYRAMDTFLPRVYEPTDTPGRYTFTAGVTRAAR